MGEDKRPRRNLFDEVATWLDRGEELKGTRTWLAQLFALLGTAFALMQLLFSALDLANRAVVSVLSWLPFLVPATLLIGALISVLFFFTSHEAQQKRWAGAAFGLTLCAATGWGGWSYYQQSRPPKGIIIVIADFEAQQSTKRVDWGRRIYERVKTQVGQLNLGDRVEVQRVFESYDSSEQARARGDARKATLVLWGWYDDLGVSPHFELLRQAQKYQGSLAAPPQDLADFDLYLRSGPQEMAYVTSVVLGLVYFSDGNYGAAEGLFSTALQSVPATGPTLLGLEVPYFYRANSRWLGQKPSARPTDNIVADLREAVTRKPEFWQAHWNLALAYTNYCTTTLALDSAVAEATIVRDLQPNNADAYWLLGQMYAERKDWKQAEAAYRKALQINPAKVEAHESLGKALEELGRAAEAKSEYARALDLRRQALASGDKKADQDPAHTQDTLGYAYLRAGQYDQAIAAFQEALRLKPQEADYHRHLGNAFYWQGTTDGKGTSSQLSQAIAEYETARGLAPNDALLLSVLGGAYQEAGRVEDALQAYQDAVAADPCDTDALFLLAYLYDEVGRPGDAEAAYRRLVELDPHKAVAWHALGTAAYMREDYAAAAQAYRSALAATPTDATLQYALASSLYFLKDYQGAEEAFRRATELAPKEASYLMGWGDSLAKLGRLDEAIAAYEKATALTSGEWSGWLSLGLLYEQAQRLADALTAYDKAAGLKADQPLIHAARSRVLQRLNKLSDAAMAMETALQYDPENASYWESLTLLYGGLNRADDALRAAGETLKRNPSDAVVYMVRGGVYADRGEKDQARVAYRQAIVLAGDNANLKKLAEAALQKLGE